MEMDDFGFEEEYVDFNVDPDEALSTDELKEKIAGLESEAAESLSQAAAVDHPISILNAEAQAKQDQIDEIQYAIDKLLAEKEKAKAHKKLIHNDIWSHKIKQNDYKTLSQKKKDYAQKLKGHLHKAAQQEKESQLIAEKGAALEAKASDFKWFKDIKRYQLDASKRMAMMNRVLNFDEMGLGKSLTALAAADLAGVKRLLVISKIDIIENFKNEVNLWAPHREIVFSTVGWPRQYVHTQLNRVLPMYKDKGIGFVVLLNFETWWNDPLILSSLINLQFDGVIIDEAHIAKETSGKTFKGLKQLIYTPNQCCNCGSRGVKFDTGINFRCEDCGTDQMSDDALSMKNVWPMTGSPILARPDEMFPLLHLVDRKGFPDKQQYLKTYCRKVAKINLRGNRTTKYVFQYGGAPALMRKIGPQLIRRTKKDVGLELPEQKVTVHTVPFTPETHPLQYGAYHDLIEYLGAIFSEENPDEAVPVAFGGSSIVTRLRQITSWPAGIEVTDTDKETGAKNVIWRCDIHESAKLDAAFEEVVQKVKDGERVVFFAKHRAVLKEFKRRLDEYEDDEMERKIRSVLYYGSTDLFTRNQIKDDFDSRTAKTSPDEWRWDVVVCQNEAASQGLNFTAATHMCIVERMWGPMLEEQQLARTRRIGQARETTVSFWQLAGTIDQDIEELLYSKREIVADFEDNAEVMQKLFERLFRKAKTDT